MTNMFAPYGKIIQSRLLLDKITNLPRGVAFVRYSKRDEAMAAIEALNHTIPEGGTLSLNVKVAEDYSKTKQMYMAQYVASQGAAAGMPSHMGCECGMMWSAVLLLPVKKWGMDGSFKEAFISC